MEQALKARRHSKRDHMDLTKYIKELGAVELDALIAQLLTERESREPPVAMSAPNPTTALIDPKWHTFKESLNGLSVIQFRHPGAGWLAFALPEHERAHLVALLAAQALVPVVATPVAPAQ
jgi:hypothetical protein